MATSKPVTLDHLRSQKKPVQKTVRFCTEPDITERLQEVERDLLQLQLQFKINLEDEDAKRKIAQLQEEKSDLLEQAKEHSIRFVFQTLGKNKFDELRTAHPPTEADKEEVRARGENPDDLGWDLHEFPIALIAACCIEPEMTYEEVKGIMDDELFSSSEILEMFQAAIGVNMRSNVVNLGKG